MLTFILTACGSAAPSTLMITPYESCIPPIDEANLYRGDPQNEAGRIFWSAQGNIQLPGTVNSQVSTASLDNGITAKGHALSLLANRVERWSKFTDVPINDRYLLRISATFISPDIIEAVVLNQVLSDGTVASDLPTEVGKQSETIKKRNELIFLLTLTLNEYGGSQALYNEIIIQIPVDQITLTTSFDPPIYPQHVDHYLGNRINVLAGPAYGYLPYPVAVLRDGGCQQVIDQVYTTTLAIEIPEFRVNNTTYPSQTLSIDYQPLLKISVAESATTVPNSTSDSLNQYSSSPNPPQPARSVLSVDQWDTYWKEMARFVWYHLTDTTRP